MSFPTSSVPSPSLSPSSSATLPERSPNLSLKEIGDANRRAQLDGTSCFRSPLLLASPILRSLTTATIRESRRCSWNMRWILEWFSLDEGLENVKKCRFTVRIDFWCLRWVRLSRAARAPPASHTDNGPSRESSYVFTQESLKLQLKKATLSNQELRKHLSEREEVWDLSKGERGVNGMEGFEDKYASTRGDH